MSSGMLRRDISRRFIIIIIIINNGRSTARLEQSARRDPSQSISGCLRTFTENSLLYPAVFSLTLILLLLVRAPLTL